MAPIPSSPSDAQTLVTAAITKLERLKASSTPAPWEVRTCAPAKPDVVGVFASTDARGVPFDVVTGWMPEGSDTDAALVVLLHATLDWQIGVLRRTMESLEARLYNELTNSGLALAKLIVADQP